MSELKHTTESLPQTQQAQADARFLTDGIEWSPAATAFLNQNKYQFIPPSTLNILEISAGNSEPQVRTAEVQEAIINWHEDKVDEWAAHDPRFKTATGATIW